MNKEILIRSSCADFKAFLQGGFYLNHMPTSHVHWHNYSEIHITNGDSVFTVGEETLHLKGGQALAIPRKILHRCTGLSEGAQHTAFQTTIDISSVSLYQFSIETVNDFLCEIARCENASYNQIGAYITLFATPFIEAQGLKAENIKDYKFLIHEFFSNKYTEDITLNDLAEHLHVSPRHAERLVKECTGNSFGRELTSARTEMAEYLIRTTDMSLADIAKQVGYRSYAGFYKAMKKTL